MRTDAGVYLCQHIQALQTFTCLSDSVICLGGRCHAAHVRDILIHNRDYKQVDGIIESITMNFTVCELKIVVWKAKVPRCICALQYFRPVAFLHIHLRERPHAYALPVYDCVKIHVYTFIALHLHTVAVVQHVRMQCI